MRAVDHLRSRLEPQSAVATLAVKVDAYVQRRGKKLVPVVSYKRDEPKITRVLGVRDTREYDDNLDPPKPIPGSGDLRDCDRCKRQHEVHVDVELDNGGQACIGSGCARQDEMAMVRKAVTSQATIGRLERSLAKAQERYDRAKSAMAEVDSMPRPEVVRGKVDQEHRQIEWRMDDAWVWQWDSGPNDDITSERRSSLEDAWRDRRWQEKMGLDHGGIHTYATEVEDLNKRLAKARKNYLRITAANEASGTEKMPEEPRLTEGEISEAFRRGQISASVRDQMLRQLGHDVPQRDRDNFARRSGPRPKIGGKG